MFLFINFFILSFLLSFVISKSNLFLIISFRLSSLFSLSFLLKAKSNTVKINPLIISLLLSNKLHKKLLLENEFP